MELHRTARVAERTALAVAATIQPRRRTPTTLRYGCYIPIRGGEPCIVDVRGKVKKFLPRSFSSRLCCCLAGHAADLASRGPAGEGAPLCGRVVVLDRPHVGARIAGGWRVTLCVSSSLGIAADKQITRHAHNPSHAVPRRRSATPRHCRRAAQIFHLSFQQHRLNSASRRVATTPHRASAPEFSLAETQQKARLESSSQKKSEKPENSG